MPASDPEFLKKLLATFREESDEHISAISSGLVALENALAKQRRTEIVETIFREAHSLKGAARAVNLGKVEAICQSLETLFAEMKTREAPLSPELLDRLHRMTGDAASEIAGATGILPPGSMAALGTVGKAGPPPGESAPQPPSDEKPALPDTVRVSTSKVAAILRLSEELVPIKMSAGRHVLEVRGLQESLASLEKECGKLRLQMHVAEPSGDRNRGSSLRVNHLENANAALAGIHDYLGRNQSLLKSIGTRIAQLRASLDNDRRILDRRLGDLLEEVKRLSMLPFSMLLAGFPKLVRELCRDCGKEAELVIRGSEIEASRRTLDSIKDPLMHLVRNCVDHGIGSPAERERSGKATRGTITIAISPKPGGRVELAVSDDGVGIDARKVIAAAVTKGFLSSDEASTIDQRRALSFIFHSGLSTRTMPTEVSGRGLGLAIVREKVEALGGEVFVESQPSQGTTFRLILPVAVATFRGVAVRIGTDCFVVPTMYVQRALRVGWDEIRSVENRPAIQVNRQAVSLVWLAEILGVGAKPSPSGLTHKMPGLLLQSGGDRVVFLVDEVLRDQEVLVKSLEKPLVRVRNIAGVATFEDGVLIPVLNVADLVRSACGMDLSAPTPETLQKPKSILVAEDSITARTLLKGILESSGYSVATAVNGGEAFELLRDRTFDLIVSDVEMPQMNGFDLTAKIRADRRLADLPVVLVTALDSREDRERGVEVGANAYLVKSSFDQSDLLGAIQRLI